MLPSLVLIGILLLCSAFFSASETAIFSLSPVQLHHLRTTKRRAVHLLDNALKRPREILITILLGNELINVGLSIVGASLIARTFESDQIVETLLSVAIIVPLVLVFGEVMPKNLALRFATGYALFAIMPLKFFSSVVSPLRVALTIVADAFIRLLGGSVSDRPTVTERDYRRLVDMGQREGVIIEEERELIHNIFEFYDKIVSSIMTPAESVFSLPIDLGYEEILDKLKGKNFSRIPFYDGISDNIVGILHLRDLFAFDHRRRSGGEQDIRSILIAPIVVEPDEKLETLLNAFQQRRTHMAIVKRAKGRIEGIVTMDDVLEDLFGEIEE